MMGGDGTGGWMRPLLRVGLALGALALAPAAGHAAEYGATLALGDDPNVAVGPDGTAHVVWHLVHERRLGEAENDLLYYCQIPPGQRRCASANARPFPAPPPELLPTRPGESPDPSTIVGRPGVFVRGAEVLVTESRMGIGGGGTFLRRSTDGGRTFAGPELLTRPAIEPDEAVLGPGRSVTFVNTNFPRGQFLQNAAFDTFTEPGQLPLSGRRRRAISMDVDLAGPRPVVVWLEDGPRRFSSRNAAYRIFNGPTSAGAATTAAMHSLASWSAPRALGSVTARLDSLALASGRAGLFLVQQGPLRRPGEILLRRFSGSTFAAPRLVNPSPRRSRSRYWGYDLNLAQDSAGRLFVLWRNSTSTALVVRRIAGRRWTDRRGWSRLRTVVNHSRGPRRKEPQIAADGGRGMIVWDQTTIVTDANGRRSFIHTIHAAPFLAN